MIFRPSDKPYQRPEAPTIYQLLKTRAGRNADAIAIAAPDRLPLTYGGLLHQVGRTVEALPVYDTGAAAPTGSCGEFVRS